MTKYLDSKPFSSKPATDDYRNGYDATFGAKMKCGGCGIVGRAEVGHRAPPRWQYKGPKLGWICEGCQ